MVDGNRAMTKTLCALYRRTTGREPTAVEPLPASGSARRYYRLRGVVTLMGVEGESVEENRAFIYLSGHFAGKGLPVPRVVAVSNDELHYLQEDLGSTLLFDAMATARESGHWSEHEVDLLSQALHLLADVQMRGDCGLDYGYCFPQPAFDRRTVSWDLAYFKNCFLRIAGVAMREDRLEDDFERMTQTLLAGEEAGGLTTAVPWGFMYRDFQSRNVMVRDGRLWLIDFQGGRHGPCLYDVASFLWQARARYPDPLRQDLLNTYLDALRTYHPAVDAAGLRHHLRHFVAFRILQTLGAYGYRGYFERKSHFLESIPPALNNLLATLEELDGAYPYLQEMAYTAERKVGKQGVDRGPKETSVALGTTAQATRSNLMQVSSTVLTVTIHSFSYRHGLPDDTSGNGGGFVFDCRAIHNPGRYERYKQMTGLDEPVIRFLEEDGGAERFLRSVYALVDASVERYLKRGFTHLSVAFGCTGGQHRSVYCAQELARHLRERYPGVRILLVHRERGTRQCFEPVAVTGHDQPE